jgi:WhiB family redox-sensing transcriptional regulator
MMTMMHALDWMHFAACEGMNTNQFFPEYNFLIEDRVLAACDRCPVKQDCLDWALDNDEKGVWGGLTEEQRTQISTVRSRVRCPDCRSDRVVEQDGSEICLSCGLSWLV